MAKPKFLRPKEDETGDTLKQLNVTLSIDMKNWVTFTAKKLGKTNSQFIREMLEWAKETCEQEEGDDSEDKGKDLLEEALGWERVAGGRIPLEDWVAEKKEEDDA